MKLSEIRKELRQQGAYQDAGSVLYHGREARLEVTETSVILYRPARKVIDNKKVDAPGPPLTMRLVLTRVIDEKGKLLAEWYLLSNVPLEWADAVWQLMADKSAPATELKTIRIRLSGRQMKRGRPFTAPALLAGLWSLLSMLDTLEQYDVAALKGLIAKVNLPLPLLQFG